ncbi:MAG TPA: aspartyl protease family protein [Gemmataceae bacterium]
MTFPIVPDGLVVDALVNLEAAALLPLRAAGQTCDPVLVRGLIDTGSDVSGVASATLQQLGGPRLSQTSTTGIGGPVGVSLYRVSLHVLDVNNPNLPWLTQPSLLVMDLAPGFPFDLLIGMDVLHTCKLTIDGPGGQFTFDF